MQSPQTVLPQHLVPLRGGVALVQNLNEAHPQLTLQLEDRQVLYTMDQQISPVFYKYIRTGTHVKETPQDIYVILPV